MADPQTTPEKRLTLWEWMADPSSQQLRREWAEMYCTLRRAERRIQKHRRIITRLIAERPKRTERADG